MASPYYSMGKGGNGKILNRPYSFFGILYYLRNMGGRAPVHMQAYSKAPTIRQGEPNLAAQGGAAYVIT